MSGSRDGLNMQDIYSLDMIGGEICMTTNRTRSTLIFADNNRNMIIMYAQKSATQLIPATISPRKHNIADIQCGYYLLVCLLFYEWDGVTVGWGFWY